MLPSMKLKLWHQYLRQKAAYSCVLAHQKYGRPEFEPMEYWITAMKHVFQDTMTYLFQSKGLEMSPNISAEETLVVRKLPGTDGGSRRRHDQINVGDVIIMKDPYVSDNHMVRRLAALEGDEMVSTQEEDESFVLEDGQCWVLSDNKSLKPKESKDSRSFGPISVTDIVGRVIYRYRSPRDHGFMVNSKVSMSRDMPVLYAELDMKELYAEKDKESKGSQS
uniref:Peptidase S26 domain-containing protein n=1 Tax=Opuntia streptacantha TaxID=393608 RepID=A0A7C8YWX7_OPUST